jgi:hypothetical protein
MILRASLNLTRHSHTEDRRELQMHNAIDTPTAPGPDRRLISDLVRFEYRSMVLRQLQITVEWQLLEWLDLAACRNLDSADRDTCRGCPVRASPPHSSATTRQPGEEVSTVSNEKPCGSSWSQPSTTSGTPSSCRTTP